MKAIPFSKFHKILIAIHLMLYISTSFITYNMVYFQLEPVYSCTSPSSNEGEYTVYECTSDDICSSSSSILSWSIDWTDSHSLDNWITWLDLHCASSY
jgi:MFS family permease